MIIDAHAHISGPDRVWEHFRELAGHGAGLQAIAAQPDGR